MYGLDARRGFFKKVFTYVHALKAWGPSCKLTACLENKLEEYLIWRLILEILIFPNIKINHYTTSQLAQLAQLELAMAVWK